jgi:transcriptional regulator GlxA family with amidase domain
MGNRFNSTWEPHVVGQTTFAESLQQDDFDVLLVPGGAAARDPALTYVDDYLVEMFPKVKYFITVCTGALFAARAGLLDNRRATTNKGAWDLVTQHGENVTWVAPARFVIDGDVWSSSGVSAGIDLTFEFVKRFYGQELHDRITVFTEIVPRAHDDDPFTDIVGIPHQGQL